jgi:hypothetical protein
MQYGQSNPFGRRLVVGIPQEQGEQINRGAEGPQSPARHLIEHAVPGQSTDPKDHIAANPVVGDYLGCGERPMEQFRVRKVRNSQLLGDYGKRPAASLVVIDTRGHGQSPIEQRRVREIRDSQLLGDGYKCPEVDLFASDTLGYG